MHHSIQLCNVINEGEVYSRFLMFLHRRLLSTQLPRNGNVGMDAASLPLHTVLFVSWNKKGLLTRLCLFTSGEDIVSQSKKEENVSCCLF